MMNLNAVRQTMNWYSEVLSGSVMKAQRTVLSMITENK